MGQQHSNIVAVNIDAFVGKILEQLAARLHSERAIMEELKEWIQSSRAINIFVTGKTGSGKSTLVNALLGVSMAPEGEELDPMTAEVACYENDVSGVRLRVWDSPGLQDGTQREEEYITDMKAKCNLSEIDLCVVCIKVSTARFTKDSTEVQALRKLTDAFGPSLWEHAIIVLTYANEIEMRSDEMKLARRKNDLEKVSRLFQDKIAEWDTQLRAILTEMIGIDMRDMKIIPTGFRKPSLPDRDHWLSTFWFGALRSMHKRAQPAMLLLNHGRIVDSPESVSKKDKEKFLHDQSLVFTECGYEIGGKIGTPMLGGQIGLDVGEDLGIGLSAKILLEQLLMGRSQEEQQSQDQGTAANETDEGQESENAAGT